MKNMVKFVDQLHDPPINSAISETFVRKVPLLKGDCDEVWDPFCALHIPTTAERPKQQYIPGYSKSVNRTSMLKNHTG